MNVQNQLCSTTLCPTYCSRSRDVDDCGLVYFGNSTKVSYWVWIIELFRWEFNILLFEWFGNTFTTTTVIILMAHRWNSLPIVPFGSGTCARDTVKLSILTHSAWLKNHDIRDGKTLCRRCTIVVVWGDRLVYDWLHMRHFGSPLTEPTKQVISLGGPDF